MAVMNTYKYKKLFFLKNMIGQQSSRKLICFDENLSDEFPVLYQNRCCDQDNFSIDVFGSESDRNKCTL